MLINRPIGTPPPPVFEHYYSLTYSVHVHAYVIRHPVQHIYVHPPFDASVYGSDLIKLNNCVILLFYTKLQCLHLPV